MQRWVAAGVVLAAMAAGAAGQERRGVDLGTLYAQKRFFELRDALALVQPPAPAATDAAPAPDPAAPRDAPPVPDPAASRDLAPAPDVAPEPFAADAGDLAFFMGASAARFNRLGEAERLLTAYIDAPVSTPGRGEAPAAAKGTPPSGGGAARRYLKEAYGELMGVSRQRHDYARVVETRRRMLSAFKGRLTRQEVSAHESNLRLWRALRDVPPQKVEITGPVRLPLVDGLDVPVTFAAGTCALTPNTGSAFSIIIRSEAKRLGFRLIDEDVGLNTGTGSKTSARLAVAPPMRLGTGVVVHNAVFLVFPDEALYRSRQQQQQRGTIGAPVLSALGAITFASDGTFTVAPATPPGSGSGREKVANSRSDPEFFFEATDIVVRAGYDGRALMLVLDTGADESFLSAHFFGQFAPTVRSRGRREWHEFGSVGGSRRLEAYSLPSLALSLGGRDLVFPGRRLVLAEATGDDSRFFHGWLGRDLFRLADSLTIDYRAMTIALW